MLPYIKWNLNNINFIYGLKLETFLSTRTQYIYARKRGQQSIKNRNQQHSSNLKPVGILELK